MSLRPDDLKAQRGPKGAFQKLGPNRRYSRLPNKSSLPNSPPILATYTQQGWEFLGTAGVTGPGGWSELSGGRKAASIPRGGAAGPWGPPEATRHQHSQERARLVLLFLLFLSRAPVAGEGWAQRGAPLPLPETALCLSPHFSSPASRPPSLLLNLLLPQMAPSGVPSCSPCFLSPPWERKGPRGPCQAPIPTGASPPVTCQACWGGCPFSLTQARE